jgi:hypothetical protein
MKKPVKRATLLEEVLADFIEAEDILAILESAKLAPTPHRKTGASVQRNTGNFARTCPRFDQRHYARTPRCVNCRHQAEAAKFPAHARPGPNCGSTLAVLSADGQKRCQESGITGRPLEAQGNRYKGIEGSGQDQNTEGKEEGSVVTGAGELRGWYQPPS